MAVYPTEKEKNNLEESKRVLTLKHLLDICVHFRLSISASHFIIIPYIHVMADYIYRTVVHWNTCSM